MHFYEVVNCSMPHVFRPPVPLWLSPGLRKKLLQKFSCFQASKIRFKVKGYYRFACSINLRPAIRVTRATVKFMLHAIKLVLLTNANSREKNLLIKLVRCLATVELSNPISFADSVRARLTSRGFNPAGIFFFF